MTPSDEDWRRAEEAHRESREVTIPELVSIEAALDRIAELGDAGQVLLSWALAGAATAAGAPQAAPLAPAVAERLRALVEGAVKKARG